MSEIQVEAKTIPLDKEGYLINLDDWSEATAMALAAQDQIALTPSHWQIINAIRSFYQQFQHAPNNRVLVKYLQQQPELAEISSITLMQLFAANSKRGSSAKVIARIAGLPRPTHCL